MEFKKYSSIENSYNEKLINFIHMNGADLGKFYVSQKIHGSNFSLITDGTDIREAKRSSIIGVSENFQGSLAIVERLRIPIINLFQYMKKLDPEVESIQVYGEIFGGSYPHPDVPKVQAPRIQKGIFYCPGTEWLAYDIRVNGGKFVDADEKYGLFRIAEVPHIKVLFRGTFNECLNYPNDFQDTIHGYFNLPTIEDNVCEGVVITPAREIVIGHSRIVLKNKNEKWKEKSREPKKVKNPQIYGPDLVKAMEEVSKYVTENRFLNVLSKEGEFKSMSQFGPLMKAFSIDVLEAFEEDNEDLLSVLGNIERRNMNKVVNGLVANIIKEYIPVVQDA